MKKLTDNVRLISIGYDNSMGFIRYWLATAVIIAHFNVIYGSSFYFPISSYEAVGAFFALSGFLIFGSYLKHDNLGKYLLGRARRILPPYFLIILVCAFSLVTISTLTAGEYFSNPQFWRYLVSNLFFLNFLQPTLPGVFITSPEPAVDASLWTMKVEITLYLSVPVIVAILSWMRAKSVKISLNSWLIIIYVISLLYRCGFTILYDITGREIYNILGRQFLGQLMYFYSGVLVYMNFRIFKKYRIYILILSAIIFVVGKHIPYYAITLGPFVIALLTLSCSFFSGWIRCFNFNNVSYEMYLFHFPVINTLHHFNPTGNIYILLIISLILVYIFSCLSWFLVDRRFLPKRFV